MEVRESKGIRFVAGTWPMNPDQATVVFLHGAGGTSDLWEKQVAALAGRVNTMALDLPGHGGSQGEAKDKVEDYAATVLDFLDRVKPLKVIPCGLSLGGAIVQQLLIDYGDRFTAGMLVCTGAKLKVMPSIFEMIKNDYNEYLKSSSLLAVSEQTDPVLIRTLLEATAKNRPEAALEAFRACDAFDVRARLSSIQGPVLVVTAEDDRLTPPPYGRFLEENIPQASRIHIAGAGHFVPLEKPEELNQAIIGFLDKYGL